MSESPNPPLLASTWAELRRRKVVRAAIAYAVVAWVVLQLGEITFEPLGLPSWVMTWTVLLAILGFPLVLVLAWLFDHDRAGLTRDSAGRGFRGPARVFALILVVLTVAGLAWWLTDVYRAEDKAPTVEKAVPKAPPAAATAPPNSIAVLPFDDLSAAGDQAWFADGIAEELLDRLARIDGLRVAARTSSFALRDSEQDVIAIGRLLNVGAVLEGSVRKADGKLRITAQLIDAGNGFHLWSETYERPDQGIFELQDEITGDIVENLRTRIPGVAVKPADAVAQATTGAADTRDVQAHELYLQGRLHWRQRTAASLGRAAELFQQAIARDRNYARAWSGLADTYLLLCDYGSLDSVEAVKLAEPAVVQALALAPGLGEAWASLGLLRLTAGQLDAAEGNLLEAIRLDPRYDMAQMWLSGLYGRQGKLKARAETLNQAHELSPLDPAIIVNLAHARFAQGDVAGARQLLDDLLAATPDSGIARRTLAQYERMSGRLAEALRHADTAWRQSPDDPNLSAELATVLAALQRFEEAQRIVEKMPSSSPIRPLMAHFVAVQQARKTPLPIEVRAQFDGLLASDQPIPEKQGQMLFLAAFSAYHGGDQERSLAYLLRLLAERESSGLLADDIRYATQAMVALREVGREAEAKRWRELVGQRYDQLLEQGIAGAATDYELASLAVFDGEPDRAVAMLAKAVRDGFSELWLIDGDPSWNTLRAIPGFVALRAEVVRRIEREREASLAIATY